MGAPEIRWPARTALAALVALAVAGCASGRSRDDAPTRPLPPQAVTTRAPSTETAPPSSGPSSSGTAGTPTSAAQELEPTPPAADDPTVIVLDDPAGEEGPSTLVEAAAQARAERSLTAPPVIRITNDNLAEHAAGGVLTIAAPANLDGEDEGATAGEPSTEETYWRRRGLEIRQRWREAYDAIPLLSAKVEDLRTRFYATDDPYVRDGQVKPEWDRAIADLEEARFKAGQGAEEVAQYLEDGRRAGALPGWLRDGLELEPEPVVETVDGTIHEPGEPPPYEADPIDP